ncbi:MAG: HAD family hydrolase [Vicinamibacteria bacterium]
MTSRRPAAVIFDLGGVLIDWNPRYLYRTLFGGDTAAMEHFLTHVCSPAWNHKQDAGRSFADGCAELVREFPDARPLIEAWRERFDETMAGPIAGTVEILAALRERGVPIYALSNWWAETFPIARARFDFLDWFDGIVISGELGVAKPDARIFAHLLATYGLRADATVFVDDLPANIAAAAAAGMRPILFTDPAALRASLRELDLL